MESRRARSTRRSKLGGATVLNPATARDNEIEELDHPALHSFLRYPIFRLMHGRLEMLAAVHSKDPVKTGESVRMTIGNVAKPEGLQVDNGDGKVLELLRRKSGSGGESETNTEEQNQQDNIGQALSSAPTGVMQILQEIRNISPNSFDACKIQILNTTTMFIYISPSTRGDFAKTGVKSGYNKICFTDHEGNKLPGYLAKSLANDYLHQALKDVGSIESKGMNGHLVDAFDEAMTKHLGKRPDWDDLLSAAARKTPIMGATVATKYLCGPIFTDGVSRGDYDIIPSLDENLSRRVMAENVLRNKTFAKKAAATETSARRANTPDESEFSEPSRPVRKVSRLSKQATQKDDNRDIETAVTTLATLDAFWWKFTRGEFETAQQLVDYFRRFAICEEGKADELFKAYFGKVAESLNLTFGLEPGTISTEGVLKLQWQASHMSARVGIHRLPWCEEHLKEYRIDWNAQLQLPKGVKLTKINEEFSD